jgi:hypothetical protein
LIRSPAHGPVRGLEHLLALVLYGANFPVAPLAEPGAPHCPDAPNLTRTYINPLVKLVSINALYKGVWLYTITYLELDGEPPVLPIGSIWISQKMNC